MKRLLFVMAIVFAGFALKAQSSTIKDYGEYILLEYDHGDTIPIPKSIIFPWKSSKGVRLYIPENFVPATVRNNLLDLSYSEFGYDNDTVFMDYLKDVIMQNYSVSYGYTAGNLDSIWYKVGTDTAYIEVFGYTSDTITSKVIVH